MNAPARSRSDAELASAIENYRRPPEAGATSSAATRKPVVPSAISSGMEPRLKAIAGVPVAMLSMTDRPNGSSN